MTKVHKTDLRRTLLAALLIVAVALAFSPLTATTAHAATSAKTEKLTFYKGQKFTMTFSNVKNSVTFKSSNSKVMAIKKVKKNKFTMTAKKAGKATLTASAKGYITSKLAITVKGSFPAGSIDKPVALGSDWKTIKSKDGKKQIKAKATVWSGEEARNQVLAIEGDPADGSAYFDRQYWNDPTVSSGKTFYLIKFDYNIVKGYPAGKGAYLSGVLGGYYYDKDWRQLSPATDYSTYFLDNVPYNSGYVPNGTAGSYYLAVFVKDGVKQLKSDDVGGIYDYQSLGSLSFERGALLSGCVSIKLP